MAGLRTAPLIPTHFALLDIHAGKGPLFTRFVEEMGSLGIACSRPNIEIYG